MAARAVCGKLYRLFTRLCHGGSVGTKRLAWNGDWTMVGISIAMLIALVAYGDVYFGWSDPKGEIQIAIVTTFILGIICGYRAKG